MLYMEIIAVCSQIHTKHINTLCGQNVEFGTLNRPVHVATNQLLRLNNKMVKMPSNKITFIVQLHIVSNKLQVSAQKNNHEA
jgi:hypothetical protein